jgi:hypothetical protein
LGSNYTIINSVEVTDIKQGGLGDCYLMSSAAAVGEFEKRLSEAFVTKTYNTEGIIAINTHVLGLKKTIYLDDYLPFWSSTSSYLAFAQPSTNKELWGPFIEKAWAKVSGNYEITEGGWASEAVRFITNSPSYWYAVSSFDAATRNISAYNIISENDALNNIMSASTSCSSGGDSVVNGVGLAQCHAYTLLSTHVLKNADGSVKDYLLKIRNPWASDGAYNGSYRDADTIWKDTVNNYSA